MLRLALRPLFAVRPVHTRNEGAALHEFVDLYILKDD